MAAFGGLILTNTGRALQAKVQAGATLHFNRIGIGDGNLGGQQISDLNALISEKKSLVINKLKTQAGGKAIIGGVLSNQDILAGFYFREIGFLAQDPDVGEILYCYANAGAGAEYIPAAGGPDVIEKQIDVIILTANAANVTADISSGLYASAADLDAHTADMAAHGATSAATPSRTVSRDANGRFKAADPAAVDDVDTQGARNAAINAAVAALINGAPAALDTLNELAAALGDDPNFATTMTNALAAKLNASAYTAADVLAKLLTVDGAGTGLDADMVDGVHGSDMELLHWMGV